MIVADTSALISLATGGILETALDEFDVHTTVTVVAELRETAEYDDRHAEAATTVLDQETLRAHDVDEAIESSRIDAGEGSCAILATELAADFLLTDDLRALPELESATAARVAISPFLLRALVTRGVLDREEALARLNAIGADRDWLESPIYRRARRLFEE